MGIDKLDEDLQLFKPDDAAANGNPRAIGVYLDRVSERLIELFEAVRNATNDLITVVDATDAVYFRLPGSDGQHAAGTFRIRQISGDDDFLYTEYYDGSSWGNKGRLEKDGTFYVTDLNLTKPVDVYSLDHDSFSGFIGNEHIDHTSVTISSGGILSGGGDISASRTITLTHSDVDHDQTTNFVSNKHIDHTLVSLTAGLGLSGGGDISSSRSFALDLSELSDIALASGDYIAIEDATDNSTKKANVTDLHSVLSHDSFSGFVSAEHIDWSATGAEDVHDDRITASSVTQHEGSINHDNLSGFVSDEHINHSAGDDGTYDVYNDGVTSGQVTQFTVTNGLITSVSVIP